MVGREFYFFGLNQTGNSIKSRDLSKLTPSGASCVSLPGVGWVDSSTDTSKKFCTEAGPACRKAQLRALRSTESTPGCLSLCDSFNPGDDPVR